MPFANLYRSLRPATMAKFVAWLPLVGLTIGGVWPWIADTARPVLEPGALTVVFCCVAATKIAPPSRGEIRTVLLMLLTTGVACPAIAGMLALMTRLPPDLALAAGLAAASPVAVGAGALCHRFGLSERPAVWAALCGLALAPALLPAVAAATIITQGGAGGIAVHSLAARAALLGALPAAVAFLFRRARPRLAEALAPDLRGIAVMGLCVLALCAGGTVARTMRITAPDEANAVFVIAVAVLVAAAMTWATERVAPTDRDPLFGRELLVVSGSRNISFVWASAIAALTPRGQAVLAVAVAGTFVIPAAVFTLSRVATAVGSRVGHGARAGIVFAQRLLVLGALGTCWVMLLLPLFNSNKMAALARLWEPRPVVLDRHDPSRHDFSLVAREADTRCGRHFVYGFQIPNPQTIWSFFDSMVHSDTIPAGRLSGVTSCSSQNM
jgi:hypothetical protein